MHSIGFPEPRAADRHLLDAVEAWHALLGPFSHRGQTRLVRITGRGSPVRTACRSGRAARGHDPRIPHLHRRHWLCRRFPRPRHACIAHVIRRMALAGLRFAPATPDTRSPKGEAWWARQDSNLQPDRYERSGSAERPCFLGVFYVDNLRSSAFVHVHAGPNRDPDRTRRTNENG